MGTGTLVTRHEFLKALHQLLRPQIYLEVGVQHGWSLQLSEAPISIGIDPEPLIQVPLQSNCTVMQMTSDEYFDCTPGHSDELNKPGIDLAFIDGMHLYEYALRDFSNIEKLSHEHTVVVFDDVLPTTQEMAAREICAGDWTGDVWRVYDHLLAWRADLVLTLVDTEPTGTLVVTHLNPAREIRDPLPSWGSPPVPAYILDRRHAWAPELVLQQLARRLL